MSNKTKIKTLSNNQDGMVAITVTLVIMILVTLIVSSFAVIVRKEQRQALDRQLSTQAFYAAESGVSDAVDALYNKKVTSDISDCNTFKAITPAYDNKIDSTGNIQYTCVLIDDKPKNVEGSSADPGNGSFVVPINVTDMDTIRISWQNQDGSATFESGDRFTKHALPNQDTDGLATTLLRATLIPAGTLTRDAIRNGSQTMFLYPNYDGNVANPGAVNYSPGSLNPSVTSGAQGSFIDGNCNGGNKVDKAYPKYCNVDIRGVSGGKWFLRLTPLYRSMSYSIQALKAGNPQEITESQVEVDVTGKASDVLRRISVRVPYKPNSPQNNFDKLLPEGALQSTDDICKLLLVTNSSVEDKCDSTSTTIPFTSCTLPTGCAGGGGGGGGGSPSGGAFFQSPTGSNGGSSGTGIPNLAFDFRQYQVNKSGNPDSIVAGCKWEWGDGTYSLAPRGSSLTDLQNNACLDNWRIRHVYPVTASSLADLGPGDCRTYQVALTVYFSNGAPDQRYPATGYVKSQAPYGTEGFKATACGDDGNPNNNEPGGPDLVYKLYPVQPLTTQCQMDVAPCFQRRYAP